MAKKDDILQELRSQIVAGHLAPGEPLPTRIALQDHYAAGPMTVQRAFAELAAEGFIEAKRGVGTQVARRPPHLHRYGLIFPQEAGSTDRSLNAQQWSRFWDALQMAARDYGPEAPVQIESYFGVRASHRGSDYARLMTDITKTRLAGVIFAHGPGAVADQLHFAHSRVPLVHIGNTTEPEQTSTAIHFDNPRLPDLAAERASALGRRRAAVLGANNSMLLDEAGIHTLARHGVTLQPWHQIRCGLCLPEAARDIVRLLFHTNAADRPDLLIIGDDNLAEEALAGLFAAGVRVPEEVMVISHWNFPLPAPTLLPFERIGYDARQILRIAIDVLGALRHQTPLPPAPHILALHEKDLAGTSPQPSTGSLER